MSPPSALQRSEESVPSLSPGSKVFLSGSILLLGTVGVLPFYQPNRDLPIPQTVGRTPSVSIPCEKTVPPPTVDPKNGSEKIDGSVVKAVPAVAVQSEKYAKAYPEPILVSGTQAVPNAPKPLEAAAKSPPPPIREFASIHRITPVAAAPKRQDASFEARPENINPSKVTDSLLPMFHFAENLKPLSTEATAKTPPDNPFQPTASEEKKLLPLRLYNELRPLRLLEKE